VSYPVVEVFRSIQGEGAHTGMGVVFVRLAHCNYSCKFCDTDYTAQGYWSVNEILEAVKSLSPKRGSWIVVTGGEPTIHRLTPLVDQLKARGYQLQIETNGSNVHELRLFDWVTCSPKKPMSLDEWDSDTAQEFKFLVGSDGLVLGECEVEGFIASCPLARCYLQPVWDMSTGAMEKGALGKIMEMIEREPGKWQLSVQMHKLLKLR